MHKIPESQKCLVSLYSSLTTYGLHRIELGSLVGGVYPRQERHESNRYGHSQGDCPHGKKWAPSSVGNMPDGHGQLEGRDKFVQDSDIK
jgi:hypothetical protein